MDKVGRYEIIKELGSGGMAEVYLAYDPIFNREVALKFIKPEYLNNSKLRKRFQREAKIMASFEHPAIVSLYNFGKEKGQQYLVMALMLGGSLRDRLRSRSNPLTLEEVMPLLERLASGLDAAHEKGVVHRDLKPGNILFDEQGNAYISDFGIAKQINRATLQLTAVNERIGTPAYMSPEQENAEKDIDGRSDIYSLGIILVELLTGSRPKANSQADLPPGCEKIIAKAMAKNRQNRYATAGEMVAALKAVVENQTETPVEDKDPVKDSNTPVTETFWWESRLVQTALALLFLIALVAVFVIGDIIGGTLVGVGFMGLLLLLSWFMTGGPVGTLALVDPDNPNDSVMEPWRLRPFPRRQSKSGPQLEALGIKEIRLSRGEQLTPDAPRAIKVNATDINGEVFMMDLILYAGDPAQPFVDDADISYQ